MRWHLSGKTEVDWGRAGRCWHGGLCWRRCQCERLWGDGSLAALGWESARQAGTDRLIGILGAVASEFDCGRVGRRSRQSRHARQFHGIASGIAGRDAYDDLRRRVGDRPGAESDPFPRRNTSFKIHADFAPGGVAFGLVLHANACGIQSRVEQSKLALKIPFWVHVDQQFAGRLGRIDQDAHRFTWLFQGCAITIQGLQTEEVFSVAGGVEIELPPPDIAALVQRPTLAAILGDLQLNLRRRLAGEIDVEGNDQVLSRPMDGSIGARRLCKGDRMREEGQEPSAMSADARQPSSADGGGSPRRGCE